MAFKDEFILQPSQQFTVSGRQEADQGLELYISPETGSLSGTVQNNNGVPVEGATVKIFTIDNIPFEHANTNASGVFAITDIPAGSYTVTASKAGYLVPNNIPVQISNNAATAITIVLPTDPNLDVITIFGKIKDSNGQPIPMASVELFTVSGATRTSVAVVNTNNDGQYLFTDLEDATYLIVVEKFGYLPNENFIGSLTQPGFYNRNYSLITDINFNSGTVSGVVIDHRNGNPVANAIVALYSVNGNSETIVRMTRTNANGLYLFGDVGTGKYIVKATVQREI